MLHEIINALLETLFMVLTAGLLTFFLGLPLGTLLAVTRSDQMVSLPWFHKIISLLINLMQSLPFLVMMVAIVSIVRLLAGKLEGILIAIIPLTLAALPHFAKMTAKALQKIPQGLIDATEAIGASPLQIIMKVLIPESLPNILQSFTDTLVHIVGFTLIAGALGAGGLGGLIIEKGYHSFDKNYVLITAFLLICLIQVIQFCGKYLAGSERT